MEKESEKDRKASGLEGSVKWTGSGTDRALSAIEVHRVRQQQQEVQSTHPEQGLRSEWGVIHVRGYTEDTERQGNCLSSGLSALPGKTEIAVRYCHG